MLAFYVFMIILSSTIRLDGSLFQNIPVPSPPLHSAEIFLDGNDAVQGFKDRGSGVPGDPYVIENRIFDAGNVLSGLHIAYTDAPILIQNCTFTRSGSGPEEGGLKLNHTQNVEIVNCTARDNLGNGIILYYTTNVSLYEVVLESNKVGLLGYSTQTNCCRVEMVGNQDKGVYFQGHEFLFSNCTCTGNGGKGIYIEASWDGFVQNCTSEMNEYGLLLSSSRNVTACNNSLLSNRYDTVWLYNAINCSFVNNTVFNVSTGMRVEQSSGCNLTGNNVTGNDYVGIYVIWSENCTISNNSLVSCGIWITGSSDKHYNHTISDSNTLDGAPYFYYVNKTGLTPEDFVGGAATFLYNCNYSTISGMSSTSFWGVSTRLCFNLTWENMTLQDPYKLAFLSKTPNCTIRNLQVDNAGDAGIFIDQSANVSVVNCTISGKTGDDNLVTFDSSSCGKIINNTFSAIDDMASLVSVEYSSNNATVLNNIIIGGYVGIAINSHNITVENNTVTNSCVGMELSRTGNVARGNQFFGAGFLLSGDYDEIFTLDIDVTNRVNGLPVYFGVNLTDLESTDIGVAGQVILVNCNHSLLVDLDHFNTSVGACLYYCTNVTIVGASFLEMGFAGVYASGGSMIQVNSCAITSKNPVGSNSGLCFEESPGFVVSNTNTSNFMMGCFVANWQGNGTIEGNRFVGGYVGLEVYGLSNGSVSHNDIRDVNGNGMDLLYVENSTIEGNNITGNAGLGIYLSDSSNNTIFANVLSDNAWGHLHVHASNNTWTNGTHGNWWGDYEARYPGATPVGNHWSVPYAINGSFTDFDFLPLLPPPPPDGDSGDGDEGGTTDPPLGDEELPPAADTPEDGEGDPDSNPGGDIPGYSLLILVVSVGVAALVLIPRRAFRGRS